VTELFLLARVADRGIAVAADQVDSVVDIGETTVVPRAAPWVRGLSALRSRVVTVIDTARALDLPVASGEAGGGRAIISRVDGHLYAFLMDELEDVGPFERRPLAAGLTLAGRWGGAAAGCVERGGEPLLVLDPAALLAAASGA